MNSFVVNFNSFLKKQDLLKDFLFRRERGELLIQRSKKLKEHLYKKVSNDYEYFESGSICYTYKISRQNKIGWNDQQWKIGKKIKMIVSVWKCSARYKGFLSRGEDVFVENLPESTMFEIHLSK